MTTPTITYADGRPEVGTNTGSGIRKVTYLILTAAILITAEEAVVGWSDWAQYATAALLGLAGYLAAARAGIGTGLSTAARHTTLAGIGAASALAAWYVVEIAAGLSFGIRIAAYGLLGHDGPAYDASIGIEHVIVRVVLIAAAALVARRIIVGPGRDQ